MIAAPLLPKNIEAASDITRSEPIILSKPRTKTKTKFSARYTKRIIAIHSIIDSGIFLPGSFTSPATYVTKIQPSKVHNTATIARPRGPIRDEKDLSVSIGKKFSEDPPSNKIPRNIIITIAAIFV